MLHLLLGRSKTGKSTQLFQQIAENSASRLQILIVPEQYSHETERRLCTACGNQTASYCEVLSFTRLCNRIMSEAGGLAEPVLDNGGRLLLMNEAVTQTASSLSVYQKASKKAAFLTNLLATADELKSYCVSPAQLAQAGNDRGGETGKRLEDLSMILTAYDRLVSVRATDPRDRLSRAKDKLLSCGYAKGKDFYLDCFTDFTPQEKELLSILLRDAHSVNVALTCDRLDAEGSSLFSTARRTALSLVELARELHVGVTFDTLVHRAPVCSPELNSVEAQLITGGCAPQEAVPKDIQLYKATQLYEEIEHIAGTIRTLVQSGQYRYREIAVIARTLDGYDDLLETVFARYEIPLFLGKREQILEKPVLTLLTAALDAIDGYEYEPMFRYLKTGLTGIPLEEVDLLENYVEQWDIRGSKWYQDKAWNWNPAGYAAEWNDAARAEVTHLDELRRQIIEPLESLRKAADASGPVLVRLLYAFLEQIQLPQRLTERAEELAAHGALQQAEEYRQLWEILVGAMEQCAELMSDAVMPLTQFAELFQLMLSQYSISTIPVSLDRVSAGDVLRAAHKEAKVVFLLGADDMHFPLVGQNVGLLTQEDRLLLSTYGCTLTPPPEQRLERELTLAYDAVCIPTEQLYISWHSSGESGLRPASFVGEIQTLFPSLPLQQGEDTFRCTAPLPAIDWAISHHCDAALEEIAQIETLSEQVERLKAVSSSRGSLSREVVKRLYGNQIWLSASKIDSLQSCHFGYFMQYGLRAKAKKAAGFDAPQVGTFIHYVLEYLLREAKPMGGIGALTEEQIKTLTKQAVDAYIQDKLGSMEEQTPRFQYLFYRLLESVDLIISNLTDELKRSQFQPIAFELGFGKDGEMPPVRLEANGITLLISGFVDRVDGWEKDGKLYLRVVDYKSGHKVFDLTEVWHGLQMQMLLYLFTLQEEGAAYFGAEELIPAGILYAQVHEVLISGTANMPEDQVQKETDRSLRRSGLLLQDQDVLDAMEHLNPGETPRFLPIRVSAKTGQISGDSLASAAQWGLLHNHINRILDQIAGEFAAGVIDADPYLHGGHSACDWCEYAAACHFEDGQGTDHERYLYQVRGQHFWEAAASKEKEDPAT